MQGGRVLRIGQQQLKHLQFTKGLKHLDDVANRGTRGARLHAADGADVGADVLGQSRLGPALALACLGNALAQVQQGCVCWRPREGDCLSAQI
jgi:hypothetical protein